MILFLYKNLGQFKIVNRATRLFYLYVLIPIIVSYLKLKHKNIISIEKRHSLLEKNNFNAFLSDIDLTIVIKNNTDFKPILKSFFKIKKLFIMFDFPEIYYQSEFLELLKIQRSEHWGIIYSIWFIRKINWNYQSILSDSSELNVIKMRRSIQIGLSKILLNPFPEDKNFNLRDFKFLNNLMTPESKTKKDKDTCYYSNFLQTTSSNSIQLILAPDEIEYFNSIIPGEPDDPRTLELKKITISYETLITKTSMRLDDFLPINTQSKEEWLNKLDLSLALLMSKTKRPIAITPSESLGSMGSMLHISWMLHNQCNKRCSYCDDIHWSGNYNWLKYDYVTQFIDKVLTHFKKDIYHFSFTGGEPVLWPHFDELCHYLKARGCEIGLTSNGSRGPEFWDGISDTLNWVCLSFHPESSDDEHLIKIIKILANKSRVTVRLMMHKEPKFWKRSIAFGEKLKEITDCGFVFVEYVPLQENFGPKSHPTVYENWQNEFLTTQNHFTVKATTEQASSYGPDVWDYITHFADGTQEPCRPNNLVANNLVNFKDWTCHIGIDHLYIAHLGQILRGSCSQGEEFGHIFDHDLVLPAKPLICGATFCPCSTDISTKKTGPEFKA